MPFTVVLDGGVNHPAVNAHTSDGYLITMSELKIAFTKLEASDAHLFIETKHNGKIVLKHEAVKTIHYH